jgi:hypothetical protein
MNMLLTADYGGSGFKGIGGTTSAPDSPKVILIPPHLIETNNPQTKEADYCGNPLDQIVIGCGGKFHAFGDYAEIKGATPILRDLKTVYTVPRTLAAVWVLAQNLNLGKQFDLHLSCLLPPGEYVEKENFRIGLLKALKSFQTPSGRYQVQLKTFRCNPEGAGVFKHYYRERSSCEDGLNGIKIGVLMLGHRNASFFWSRDKKMSGFTSSDLGFSKILTRTRARTIDYKDSPLIESLAKYLTSNDQDALDPVLLNKDQSLREKEKERLCQAITEEATNYTGAIFQWISQKVKLDDIGEFIIAGGGCEPLKNIILPYLRERLPVPPGRDRPGIFLHGGMQIPDELLIPANQDKQRFADVFGLWSEDLIPNFN